ncbi:hypothetical protein TNCV_3539721 [Trichonephila clavipes]|nr:hypothetical protein TNCV_3539721 [Trichonephila clavipes]
MTPVLTGKTSLTKQKSVHKEKLSERDRRVLMRIVMSKKRTTAAKMTAELKEHLESVAEWRILELPPACKIRSYKVLQNLNIA